MRLKVDGKFRVVFFAALALLVLGVMFGVVSIYPAATIHTRSNVMVNQTFRLSPHEIHHQGLGAFEGNEKLTLTATSSDIFVKEFSLSTYNGSRYNLTTSENITYSFQAAADYYEAVFSTNQSGTIHFEAQVERPLVLFPFEALNLAGKILFVAGLALATLAILGGGLSKLISNQAIKTSLPSLEGVDRRRLLALVGVSLAFWFLATWVLLPALAPNSLGTLENWYTDHARHSYVSSLFLKDGFAVFGQPLETLASHDNSFYMFVTWPEMSHLYPLGSIFIFLPFGVMLQNGVLPLLVFQLEISFFLLVAHVCLFFFMVYFLKQPIHVSLKLVGFLIVYLSLVIYAANGMFDSVAFFFSLFAVFMFMTGRYDRFFLFIAVSIFIKYQMALFLFPLMIVGILMLLKNNSLPRLLRNWAVVLGTIFLLISGATAYVSAPYLMGTRPEMVMNGVNAFAPRPQITWNIHAFAVLFTLAATVVYALYMLNKNRLLTLSALFLLVPSFFLPYFQNWYIPFIYANVFLAQDKKQATATVLWLTVLVGVLYTGGLGFNFMQLIGNFVGFFWG
ncbi:MAG: hypothetical protein NWE93_09265 [Candidatus Bathyarchaeota archaeon]|nr:hypothetical protein [Candidatus Bathyarchaeota archaeon]